MVKKIDKVMFGATSVVSIVSYVGFLAVMGIIVVDVFMRKLTGSSISGAYELVERTLMFAVFASFAYTQSLHGHVHVTMFISKFPNTIRMFVFGLTGVLSTVAAFMLSYAAYVQALSSMADGSKTGVLGIPLAPFFWAECICMIIFGIALVWDAIKAFIGLVNKEVAEDVQSTWS